MSVPSIQVAAARLALGVLTSAELVRAADEALELGVYSDSLGELATVSNPIMAEVGPIFLKSLKELGISCPSKEEAAWMLLRHHIARIANETIPAREGLRQMMREVYYPANLSVRATKCVGDSHGLEYLIGDFYAYDDLEERPTEVSFEEKYGEEAIQALDRQVIRHAKTRVDVNRAEPR